MVALLVLAAVSTARPQAAAAEAGVVPWSAPETVAAALQNARRPSLGYSLNGQGHAVWESQGVIFYATQTPGGPWSASKRVATGMEPTLQLDPQGRIHVLYTNQFMGNYEIYHVYLADGAWSLPNNVSHTTGFSALPVLTITPQGTLHAAWQDNTPGYWIIYTGELEGDFWSSVPVFNARGQAPAINSTANGIYLAWQDRVINPETGKGVLDILLTQSNGNDWTLPVNISDSAAAESLGVDLAVTRDGLAHVVWADDNRYVRYCTGQEGFWSYAQTVRMAPTTARGPRILAESGALLHVAWDEGTVLRATTKLVGDWGWLEPSIVTAPAANLSDISLTIIPKRGIGIGWVQKVGDNNAGVYESWRGPAFTPRLWIPLTTR